MPMRGFAIAAVVFPLVASATTGLAQIDPKNIPKPPAEELKRFEPFLGTYDSTTDFGGQDWQGSIEIKRAVKGWYVEWTYSYRSTSGIERELKQLITWDTAGKKYRVWRFETLPPGETNEGQARFEGDDLIMESASKTPDARTVRLRNRCRIVGEGRIEVASERSVDDGAFQQIGITTGKER